MTLISFFNGKQTFFHINPVEINQTEVINCFLNGYVPKCPFFRVQFPEILVRDLFGPFTCESYDMIYPSSNQLVKSSSALNTVNRIMLDFRHTKKRTWWKNSSCLKI